MNSFIKKSARKLSLIFACAFFAVSVFGNAGSITARAESRQLKCILTEGKSYYCSSGDVAYNASDYLGLFYEVYGKYLINAESVTQDGHVIKRCDLSKNPKQGILYVFERLDSEGYECTVRATDDCTGECKVVINKKNLEEFYRKAYNDKDNVDYQKLAIDAVKMLEKRIDDKYKGDGSSEYVFIFKFGKPEFVKRTITLDFRDGNEYKSIGEEVNRIIEGYTYMLYDLGEYFYSYENVTTDCAHIEKVILSSNPKQVIDITWPNLYDVSIKAEEGCSGEFSIVLNKDAFDNTLKDSEHYYGENFGKQHVAVYERYLDGIEEGDGLSEYTLVIKFGTKPVEEEKPEQTNPAENTPAQETAPQQAAANQVQEEAPAYVAGTKFESKGLKYAIIDAAGNVKLSGVKSKNAKSVSVPATVKYNGADLKVTTIGTGAIKGLNKITKVTLGANVTTLQKKSIYSCKKLKTLKIDSKKLTSVSKNAVGKNAKGFSVKVKKSCKKDYKSLFKKAGMGKISIK